MGGFQDGRSICRAEIAIMQQYKTLIQSCMLPLKTLTVTQNPRFILTILANVLTIISENVVAKTKWEPRI